MASRETWTVRDPHSSPNCAEWSVLRSATAVWKCGEQPRTMKPRNHHYTVVTTDWICRLGLQGHNCALHVDWLQSVIICMHPSTGVVSSQLNITAPHHHSVSIVGLTRTRTGAAPPPTLALTRRVFHYTQRERHFQTPHLLRSDK
jgi:hypothetical protein